MLTNCLINRNIKEGGKMWIRNLKYLILQNFKKIRMKKHENKSDLYISKLIEKNRLANAQEKLLIEKEISEKIFEKIRKIILDQVGEMVDNSSNMSRLKMWKVKQKVCPKTDPNYTIAKMNEKGELITEQSQLKNLYTEVYKSRLRNREIRSDYIYLKDLKNQLFGLRLNLAKLRKSESWKHSDLLKVTKKPEKEQSCRS